MTMSDPAKSQPQIFRYLFGLLAIAAVIFVGWQTFKSTVGGSRSPAVEIAQIRANLVTELELLGLARSARIDPEGGIRFGHPPSMTADDLMLLLRRMMRDNNLVLTSAVKYEDRQELYVELSTPQQEKVARFTFVPLLDRPMLAEGVRGRIAIIIDDFGYIRNRLTAGFMDFQQKLTFSIIPGRRFSQVLADEATAAGQEVIVHMPMEPENYNGRDEAEFILLYGMAEEEIRARIHKAFQTIPQAVGINNHEGSLASLDTVLLDIVAKELLDRGKFYVDSFTTPGTRGLEVMQRRGVPALGRQIFIDNVDDPEYIRQQLQDLAAIAERRGFAIGIGHVGSSHLHTLEVLKKELPKLAQQGFEFVLVSEIMPASPF